jgi:hypothetical protein
MVKLRQTLSRRSVQSGLVTSAIILVLILIGPVLASPGQSSSQDYGYGYPPAPPGPPGPEAPAWPCFPWWVGPEIPSGTKLPPDTTPPVISNVSASDITTHSATINWKTDEEGDSQVEYWSSPHEVTPLDPTLCCTHCVHLANLTPETTYHFTVMSCDKCDNQAVSAEYTFTTLAAPTPKPVNWWLIGGIIAGVVVIGLLVYFLWWRRRMA